jgi:uncharacterized membrane protein YbhN (UPF0104 family)
MSNLRSRILAWIKLGLGLAILIFLVSSLIAKWEQVVQFDWHFQPALLIGSAIAAVVNLIGHGLLWVWIVRRLDVPLAYRTGTRLYVLSQMAKYIPGGVWQFATLTSSSQQLILPGSLLVVTYILDILLTVWACLPFSLPLLTLSLSAGWLVVILLFGGILLGPRLIRQALHFVVRWRHLPDTIQVERLTTYRTLFLLFLAFSLLHILIMLSFMLYLLALVDLPLGDAVYASLAWLTAWLIGFLVLVAPSGLGIREASLVVLLQTVLPGSIATMVAVGHRFASTVIDLSILLGLFMIPPLLKQVISRFRWKSKNNN